MIKNKENYTERPIMPIRERSIS